jgi:hypothetical protein
MSGTSNTYLMACWMKEIAGACMQEIKIVMIDEADAGNEAVSSGSTLVGVLFPAHGFMPPWSMIKFLLKIRRQKTTAFLDLSLRSVPAMHGLLQQRGLGGGSLLGGYIIFACLGSYDFIFAIPAEGGV